MAHWPQATLDRISQSRLALSPFTIAEERYGWLKAKWPPERIAASEQRLRSFLLIPLDLDIVARYAQLRVDCEQQGLSFGYHDLWIAATAIERGLILVSCDKRQCSIPGIQAVYLSPKP